MSKYRKKGVVIDAFIWLGEQQPDWFIEAVDAKNSFIEFGEHPQCTIKTLDGEMRVSDGDYIIKTLKGELYPCKPDIFKATYDKDWTISELTDTITKIYRIADTLGENEIVELCESVLLKAEGREDGS